MLNSKVLVTATVLAGALAQGVQAASPSQAAVLFLLISPGARAGGMGEANVALADDATATWWNTAGLGFQRGGKVTLMHTNWLPQFNFNDLYYDFAGGSYFVNSLGGTLGANIIFLNMGSQRHTDENNNDLGDINSYDLAASISYGTQLSPNLAVGLGGKFIYSNLATGVAVGSQVAEAGKAVALDLGLLYRRKLLYNLQGRFGLSITNMGNKIFYADQAQADPLPTNFKFGYALKYSFDQHNQVALAMDCNKPMYKREDTALEGMIKSWFPSGPKDEFDSWVYNMGLEYWYGTNLGRLGNASFGVRTGYWVDILGLIRATTYGASIRLSGFSFDFSYEAAGEDHPLTDTMRFSVGMDF